MRTLAENQKDILKKSYAALLENREPPYTPQYLVPLKPLIEKGFLQPVNFVHAGKVYVRFSITSKGIDYLSTNS